jgi:hypothetical protein
MFGIRIELGWVDPKGVVSAAQKVCGERQQIADEPLYSIIA